MKQFLTTFLAVIVAQVFLLFVVVIGSTFIIGIVMMGKTAKEAEIPRGAYLVQKIPATFPEYEPERRLPIPRRITSQTTILDNLDKAGRDPRVRGVILKIDPLEVGWGKLQEIRMRVAQVRATGKPVLAYADFATHKTLYLASACDSIYVPPQGMIWLTGLMAEDFYVKNLLDKIGVQFQVSQIKEYKSAAELITRTDMSPDVRANVGSVVGDLYDEFLNTTATDRHVDRGVVESWLQTAMYDPEGASQIGIIDGVMEWEDLTARLKGDAQEFAYVDGDDYAAVPRGRFGQRGKRIAVVHGQGMITMGESGWAYPFGVSMGDETMAAALEEVRKDDTIAGVVLRLDTPGGMSIAADRIGRMVERVGLKKPLVVSSVDMNASGGYMVSYRCSTLVALPTSIVGSIGSIAARGSAGGLLNKLGITTDRITVGPNATIFSPVTPLTADEFARFNEVHWEGYDDWVAGVAEYRNMTVAQVDQLARGRVFTGRQAVDIGLFDDLGGFDTALELVKQKAGIPASEPVTLLHYPIRKSLWEELMAGDFSAAFADILIAVGLRSPLQEDLNDTIAFWRTWIEADQPLAVHWWRY